MNQILAYIGYLILALNTTLYFKCFSKNGKTFKVFTIYLILIFILQLFVETFTLLRLNNLFLSHFYFILQFILLSFFYLSILKNTIQQKVIRILLIICPLALSILYTLNPSLIFKFNLFEIFITSFPIIIFATFHLYNLLNEERKFHYINLGILIYLFGSTVLFLTGNLINVLSTELKQLTWILNSALYIIYQLFIFVEWKKNFSKNNAITQ